MTKKSIQLIKINKLLMGKYKYKISIEGVLKHRYCWWGAPTIDAVLTKLKHHKAPAIQFKIANFLKENSSIHWRLNYGCIDLYSNDRNEIERIKNEFPNETRKIFEPASDKLEKGTIILKRIDFGYKVTLKYNRIDTSAFYNHAINNEKYRLPKSVISGLKKNVCYQGSHFYVKDDKQLMMVQLYLGDSIKNIEKVIKE